MKVEILLMYMVFRNHGLNFKTEETTERCFMFICLCNDIFQDNVGPVNRLLFLLPAFSFLTPFLLQTEQSVKYVNYVSITCQLFASYQGLHTVGTS